MSTFKLLDNYQKPREKLKRSDVNLLSDAELLSIVIGSGTKGNDVFDISNTLLKEFNGLSNMQSCSINEFLKVKGIGEAKAMLLYTIFEITKRANKQKFHAQKKIMSKPQYVYEICREMEFYSQEKVVVLSVNIRMELIAQTEVFVGEIASVNIHPREIFKTVFTKGGYGFILVHNHPSGYSEASEDDLRVTQNIALNAKNLDISFVDHVIVARDGYYSIREHHNHVFK